MHAGNKVTPGTTKFKVFSMHSSFGADKAIGCYDATIQELIVIDDLLSIMVDASMDLALQEFAKRLFPLCESYILINQFVETRSQFKTGLVNHAFAAALRALLLDYQSMVAQLEHQFRLGKLSIQGLWFYCQAKAMAGDHVVRSLLEKMSHSANTAYLGILERWGYEGVIDDPYGEFFIAENKSLQKESLTQDYDAKYWQQRYSLKDDIPSFLANAAETILITGKYLNVMRECGHSIQIPVAEKSKLTSVGSNHHYLECIKSAYDFASGELLNLVKNKYDLMGKLQSIKHYLLLDQGDFLVHFMDTAKEELMKKSDEISVEKLQSLLDLALRSTAASTDPCHEDLLCGVERTTLLQRLSTLKDLEISRSAPDSNDLEEPLSITGLETFSLNYKLCAMMLICSNTTWQQPYLADAEGEHLVFFSFICFGENDNVQWPLSLFNITQFSGAWQVHQGLRKLDMQGTTVSVSSLLCRNMLKLINSLLHYLTFEAN
ncbi:hypothetical protein K7X08_017348 [Anisodus acutangulus]|uniref:Gamma-tubulin complex component n=1 Tax=Anisodus acutangulus TaxID=402998 RepID=A0A9Q1LXI5_9SOLA|nr:hypothetical protein K7X08_017348 [Anisodus acutangulus]